MRRAAVRPCASTDTSSSGRFDRVVPRQVEQCQRRVVIDARGGASSPRGDSKRCQATALACPPPLPRPSCGWPLLGASGCCGRVCAQVAAAVTRDCQLHVAALRLKHPSEDEGVRRPLIHYALRLTQHPLTHPIRIPHLTCCNISNTGQNGQARSFSSCTVRRKTYAID